jgi:succinate dehydrogenase/fumarate reductase flavoprotein subunit
LKPPLDEIAPWGMGIASGADLRHFLNATRTLASFAHVAKRVARHAIEKAAHGRGLHLVAGNALVARLLASADALGVRILTRTAVQGVTRDVARVTGVIARSDNGVIKVTARRGVVLACGGFPHDPTRLAEMVPHSPTGREHFSAAPRTNTGDGLRLGETAGAAVVRDFPDAGAWAPVSRVPHADGTVGHYPHLLERAKPGLIMVLPDGRRFTNEANAYHDVMRDLLRATPQGSAPRCWMICDTRFIRRYGLGRVRPFPFPKRAWLSNGYLKSGATWRELASACGIDAGGLEHTIACYNPLARNGEDAAFGRGLTPYNKIQGDPGHTPNPCVAPIEAAPYYAVEIVPGSLGTFAGLRTDENASVVDAHGDVIAGLYAAGNDMASMMGGNYPAGGITLGPAMTFGYIAAHHAAGVSLDTTAAKIRR